MNAIVPISPSFGEMERLADAVAKSNLFGIKTRDQALVLMAIAHAEGRHPALAARDYDIIQGRPAKKAEAMLRDFLEAGGKVEWHALNDTCADATFSHPMGGSIRISWDMERAKTAGLTVKENYKKFPRQMLRSRCVSEGVRTVYPAATSGMYEPGEAAEIDARPLPPQIVSTAQAISDDLPDALRGDYGFMTRQGGRMIGTSAEWIGAWGKLIANCKAADALDKLAAAKEMNSAAIAAVYEFDAGAADTVLKMLTDALPAPASDDGWPGPVPEVANAPENAVENV